MGINKDQIEGRAKKVGGQLEAEVGKVRGSAKHQVKGLAKEAVGTAQAALGDAAEAAKKANKQQR